MSDRVAGIELYRDDHLLVRDHGRDQEPEAEAEPEA